MSNERQNKKEWERPELIVLARSKPEEAVLTACKFTGSGPSSFENWCKLVSCLGCVVVASS
jgi:hypothetical protein